MERISRIYAVIDPRTNGVRYIGITVRALNARWRNHLYYVRHESRLPVHAWIRFLQQASLTPTMILLEETTDRDREIFWISHYRSLGFRLLNCTEGGGGTVGRKQPESERLRRGQSQKGRTHTPEARALIAAAKRGSKHTPEAKAKMRAQKLGDRSPARLHPETVARGSRNGSAKLTETQVAEIRRRYAAGGVTQAALATTYGVHPRIVNLAIQGKTWKHCEAVSYHPTHGASLNEARVREIRARWAAGGVRQRDLAREFGVGQGTIWRLLSGKTWNHLG